MGRGRKPKEIEEAIITAIKNGARSLSDIRILAGVGTHTSIRSYMNFLIDKGIVEEADPSFFDHGNVKTIFKLKEIDCV